MRTTPKRRDLTSLGYRRIVQLLVYLVIVPVVLLSTVGVLLLILGEARFNLLMGILVLTFSGTLATGVILVWVFLRRERDVSELQADFVSKVSHELRTPLTSIRMFTETLMLRRGDKVAEDRCIEALTKESARLQAAMSKLSKSTGSNEKALQEAQAKRVEAEKKFEEAKKKQVEVEKKLEAALNDAKTLGEKQKKFDEAAKMLDSLRATDRSAGAAGAAGTAAGTAVTPRPPLAGNSDGKARPLKSGDCTMAAGDVKGLKDCVKDFNR